MKTLQQQIEFHSREAAGHYRQWKHFKKIQTVMGQDRIVWHQKQEAAHRCEVKRLKEQVS